MKRFKLKKLNNDGAALIFAILIVMFITIITSLLLYVAAVNYEMKSTDYNTKVSFYDTEIPLEELRMQMAIDVSAASEKAYRQVMQKYSALTDGTVRKAEYQNIFFTELEKMWEDRKNPGGVSGTWKDAIKTALNNNVNYDIIFDDETPAGGKQYHIVLQKNPAKMSGDIDTDTDYQLYKEDVVVGAETQRRMVLQNIKVIYTSENGFTSEILTNFCIVPPEIDWTINASKNDSSVDASRTRIIFEECVTYLNWKKQ